MDGVELLDVLDVHHHRSARQVLEVAVRRPLRLYQDGGAVVDGCLVLEALTLRASAPPTNGDLGIGGR